VHSKVPVSNPDQDMDVDLRSPNLNFVTDACLAAIPSKSSYSVFNKLHSVTILISHVANYNGNSKALSILNY
jgi:hypothetical protein